MHTQPNQEVSQQFWETLRSRIENGNNAETPGIWRNLHASLQYPWPVGWTTICKFIPKVSQTIPDEFQEYLSYPTKWKNGKRCTSSEPDGMTPHSWDTRLENIAIKKPKKSVSEYYNYQGLFSLVLLALVDVDYRFIRRCHVLRLQYYIGSSGRVLKVEAWRFSESFPSDGCVFKKLNMSWI